MLQEQRAHRRYPILLTGSATTGRSRFEVVCTNIGPGGGFFASRIDPPTAAEVEITLHVAGPASPPVALTGTVVYVTSRGNGRVGGFGLRWLRALSNFGVEPLRHVLEEVVRIADTGHLAADESGTATFEFGNPVRPPAPVAAHEVDLDDSLTEAAHAVTSFETDFELPEQPSQQAPSAAEPEPESQPEPAPRLDPESEHALAAAPQPVAVAAVAVPQPAAAAFALPTFNAAAAESAPRPFGAGQPDRTPRESALHAGAEPPRQIRAYSQQLVAPGAVPVPAHRIFAAPAGDAPIEIEALPARQFDATSVDDPFAPAAFAVELPPPEPAVPISWADVTPPAVGDAPIAQVAASAIADAESIAAAQPAPEPEPAAPTAPAANPAAPARISSVIRRLTANRPSGAEPVVQPAAAAEPSRQTVPAPETRLSSVLRRVRASQEARASQSVTPLSAPAPATAPLSGVIVAESQVAPAAAPEGPAQRTAAPPGTRAPPPIVVAAAIDAQQVLGEHAVNEHTVAYTRDNAPLLQGKRPIAPPTWPAGIPVSLADRYGTLELIGQGGHGVVYKAMDLHLNRQVVLKFLAQSSMATEMARKYFLREVKLAASLNHPNIVHIYDIAKVEDVLYYAMEYVDGVPLTAFLPIGTAITDDAFLFSVFTQICDALDHAHQQGVLHRDVKPENVLVAPDGTVKLFDFGLAWAQGEGFGEQSVLMGTPYYMAPEQLLGAAVDHRADIYALGVVLFRMLTGVLPFSEGNIFAAHAIEPVPDPRKFNPIVAPAAVGVVRKMMAKQPGQRPMDCRAAAVELYQALFVDRGGVL